MHRTRNEQFEAYANQAGGRLRRVAYLICGDWQDADDAVQETLIKLYTRWPSIREPRAMDAYVRRMLANALIDSKRRPWRRERQSASLPEQSVDAFDPVEHLNVKEALAQVPPGQRAVLVLRFYEGYNVAETAQILGCSTGNVKSQTARGLAHLETLLDYTNAR